MLSNFGRDGHGQQEAALTKPTSAENPKARPATRKRARDSGSALHRGKAYDHKYYTSDDCPNDKFRELLRKIVGDTAVGDLRHNLDKLHNGNLLLQRQTEVYRLLTGKGMSNHDVGRQGAECARLARVNPAWMLTYGPAGDLPVHLAFIMGRKKLGIAMLEALADLDDETQEAYWNQAQLLLERYPQTILTKVPAEKSREALLMWILNLPYQNDLLWWFEEVRRREDSGAEGASDLAKVFNSLVPRGRREEALNNDAGLFTGETLIHIAIQGSDHNLLEWLITRGANLDARARGLFFQPRLIPMLSDKHRWWRWRQSAMMEVNHQSGCYYGELPLSFAASIGNIDMAKAIMRNAKNILDTVDRDGARTLFTDWLDDEATILMRETEGFSEQSASEGGWDLKQRRFVAFVNAADDHGNTALHMAVHCRQKDMAVFLIKHDATASLTRMNGDKRTPLTAAVWHPEVFNAILEAGFHDSVWQYGDAEMTVVSLYQLDSFRVKTAKKAASVDCFRNARLDHDAKAAGDAREIEDQVVLAAAPSSRRKSMQAEESLALDGDNRARTFKLHARDGWQSALELVVSHGIHVLHEVPVFEQLIELKWRAFGKRHHLLFTVLPYLACFAVFHAALLHRCDDIQDAFFLSGDVHHNATAARTMRTPDPQPPAVKPEAYVGIEDLRDEGERRQRVVLDILVYCGVAPWIVYQAWLENRLSSAVLDANEDMKVSYQEVTLYLLRNLRSIGYMCTASLLIAAAGVRVHHGHGWFSLPYVQGAEPNITKTGGPDNGDSISPAYLPTAAGLEYELNILSVCSFFMWINLLGLLLPFHRIGQLTLTIYASLVGDVARWTLIFIIFLGAFGCGSYMALIMTDRAATDVFLNTVTSRDMTLMEVVRQFCYMSAGEVVPGNLLRVARNPELINLYNLSFMVLATIMLVNLLVGLMSSTFTHHNRIGRQIWWLEFADLVLRYEQRLSQQQRIRFRTGEELPTVLGDQAKDGCCEFFFVSMKKNGESPEEAHPDDGEEENEEFRALRAEVHGVNAQIKHLSSQMEHLSSLLATRLPSPQRSRLHVHTTEIAPQTMHSVKEHRSPHANGEQRQEPRRQTLTPVSVDEVAPEFVELPAKVSCESLQAPGAGMAGAEDVVGEQQMAERSSRVGRRRRLRQASGAAVPDSTPV